MNHSSMIGPNSRPTPPVPKRCAANRPTISPIEIGTTRSLKAVVATFRPSTALSTEIAGVSRQSP